MWKYKIEEWENEWSSGPFYVSFVRRRLWGWREIGRSPSLKEAEELCRKHEKPGPGPWLYTADSILSVGSL